MTRPKAGGMHGELDTYATGPIHSKSEEESKRVKAHIDRKAGKTLAQLAAEQNGGYHTLAARLQLAEWLDIFGLNGREIRLNDDHLTKFNGKKPKSQK